jgi:hypothetical protein
VSDPFTNPYAPPAAPAAGVTGFAADHGSASDYESERRSVLLVLLLCVVSLGFYAPFWYLRRRPFLDSLDADKKVGLLPLISAVLQGVFLLCAVFDVAPPTENVMHLLSGLFGLFVSFRVAAILRSDFARTGRFIGISSMGVFVFGCLYLQHVINEAACVPARQKRRAD